jgi:hypothetical protein
MRGDSKVRWVPLIAVLFLLVTGCSGNGAQPETYSTTVDNSNAPIIESTFSDGPLDWYQTGLLGNTNCPTTDNRTTSAGKTVIYGDEYVDEYGANNRPGESTLTGHIIAPGGDDDLLAWATYDSLGYVNDRPVSLSIDVDSVIAPGGDDDLPMLYWVAVSDFSSNTWQWHGPFTNKKVMIKLNNDVNLERYVSVDYSFSFTILTNCRGVEPTPANPDGITAVEIAKSTVMTKAVKDKQYFTTLPVYTEIDDLYVGTPDAPYVTLTWVHYYDDGSTTCEADTYAVLRRHVDSLEPELIGMLAAPGETFVDPTDALVGSTPPEPGESYYYYLQPMNTAGAAAMAIAGPITFPE